MQAFYESWLYSTQTTHGMIHNASLLYSRTANTGCSTTQGSHQNSLSWMVIKQLLDMGGCIKNPSCLANPSVSGGLNIVLTSAPKLISRQAHAKINPSHSECRATLPSCQQTTGCDLCSLCKVQTPWSITQHDVRIPHAAPQRSQV